MVMPYNEIPMSCKEAGKVVIPCDVLRHTVNKLNDSLRLTFGYPIAHMNVTKAGGRFKKRLKLFHTLSLPLKYIMILSYERNLATIYAIFPNI